MNDTLRVFVGILAVTVALVTCTQTEDPHDDFPLEGQHAVLLCETCHGLDGFGPLPSQCAECHEDDRPPNHYAGDCGDCHSPVGWLSFGDDDDTDTPVDHSFLPLVNSHDIACGNCHVGDDFTGLDATCETCHDRPDPNHHAGQDCAPCHAPTVFSDGKVHTFVLPHGDGTIQTCTDCHPDPANYATAICTTCHPVADMEVVHANVGAFAPDDPSCIGCHSTGSR